MVTTATGYFLSVRVPGGTLLGWCAAPGRRPEGTLDWRGPRRPPPLPAKRGAGRAREVGPWAGTAGASVRGWLRDGDSGRAGHPNPQDFVHNPRFCPQIRPGAPISASATRKLSRMRALLALSALLIPAATATRPPP